MPLGQKLRGLTYPTRHCLFSRPVICRRLRMFMPIRIMLRPPPGGKFQRLHGIECGVQLADIGLKT